MINYHIFDYSDNLEKYYNKLKTDRKYSGLTYITLDLNFLETYKNNPNKQNDYIKRRVYHF